MRMCTVYRSEGGVREMLIRDAEPLLDAIDQLGGKAEWGVKVFTDLARARGRTQNADAGADEGAEILGNPLFEIEPEPVLRARAADRTGRRRLSGGLAHRYGVEIGSKIAAGQPE